MRRAFARRARRLAVVLTVLASACADDGPAGSNDIEVVDVTATPCDRPLASRGVGLVVANDVVVTAAHVVDGPRRGVTVAGAPAEVLRVDARTDLALLRADVDGSAELIDEPRGALSVHTPAGALAAALVRTGPLIVHDTSADARHRREVHTISPGVAGGTSGAPLADEHGGVLGIVVLDNPTDGTAYAVTSAEVAAVMAHIREQTTHEHCPE